jgi:hypothetical protein
MTIIPKTTTTHNGAEEPSSSASGAASSGAGAASGAVVSGAVVSGAVVSGAETSGRVAPSGNVTPDPSSLQAPNNNTNTTINRPVTTPETRNLSNL